jgi:hypothetical protein
MTQGAAAMQQVADWLEKLGLGQYAQRFAENNIPFSVLPDLTDQHLKEVGVSLGHRLQLLRAIGELTRESPKPSVAIGAAATSQNTAERRQITVMFSELVGSTALSARMDPEDLRELISRRPRSLEEITAKLEERAGPANAKAPPAEAPSTLHKPAQDTAEVRHPIFQHLVDLRSRPAGMVSTKLSDASHLLLKSLVPDHCGLSPFAGSR